MVPIRNRNNDHDIAELSFFCIIDRMIHIGGESSPYILDRSYPIMFIVRYPVCRGLDHSLRCHFRLVCFFYVQITYVEHFSLSHIYI